MQIKQRKRTVVIKRFA